MIKIQPIVHLLSYYLIFASLQYISSSTTEELEVLHMLGAELLI